MNLPDLNNDADSGAIAHAAALLRGGSVVGFPTETVYGLGADAENKRAVVGEAMRLAYESDRKMERHTAPGNGGWINTTYRPGRFTGKN